MDSLFTNRVSATILLTNSEITPGVSIRYLVKYGEGMGYLHQVEVL